MIKKYRFLDAYGKEAVDGVLDVEHKRCKDAAVPKIKDKRETLPETAEEIAPETEIRCYIVPAFLSAMSAGTGQPAGDEYAEDFKLIKRPPNGTSFIAHVSGDSMEPTYYDGDWVFIRATVDVRPGQIGVFFMDGEQYIKELGNGVLISHNAKYAPLRMTPDIRCQGLVLGVCDESYFE